ncbi:MAG TPA: YfcE family phosphodiesterase [Clostridiales bacterium]|nr:YfcE family phosphodiesterase [Clostridiales bacterium]
MNILVCSDSHGRLEEMIAAVEEEQPDYFFFLGDHDRDGRQIHALYPHIPYAGVRGNCDFGPGEEERVVELEGVRMLLTHGHRYQVKGGLDWLAQAAWQQGADLVCFGHTHRAVDTAGFRGVRLFNPGSVGGVHAPSTYGILRVERGQVACFVR